MTLPVLPSLIPVDLRLAEPGTLPVDAGQGFRDVLSTVLGMGTDRASDFRLQTSAEASGVRLQAAEQGSGFRLEAPGTPATAPAPDGTDGEMVLETETAPLLDVSVLVPTDLPAAAAPIVPVADPVVAFVPAIPGAIAPVEPVVTEAPVPVTRPELHPEFRDRLERVIDRMESEFGYKVEVVETVRSQSRQDALYAQGRERPGQVVTWTRNSRHTEGLAADLVIDGSYVNPLGYERLSQVAREEGLRTLGPRDQGHVELPKAVLAQSTHSVEDGVVRPRVDHGREIPAWASRGVRPATPSHGERARQVLALNPNDHHQVEPAPSQPIETPFVPEPVMNTVRVAAMAKVAQTAQVATVASVAPVAVPGTTFAPVRAERPEKPGPRKAPERAIIVEAAPEFRHVEPVQPGARSTVAPTLAPADVSVLPDDPSTRQEPATDRTLSRETAPMTERPDGHHVVTVEAPTAESFSVSKPERIDAPNGVHSLDRVREILDLRESAAERPLSSVLLRLDSPDGSEDRIRIGLRGTSLDAAFDMADRSIAEDLGRNLAELARSVERQGLEPEQLLVRTSSTRESASALSQAIAGEREGIRASATNAGMGQSTGREGRAPRQDASPEESPRHRQRRDHKGDR